MSALAALLCVKGYKVSGSDRSFDKGETLEKFETLKDIGVNLCPQDGTALKDVDVLVVSSAIETSIPDVIAAKEQGIPIQKRAALLAEFFNKSEGIAVGGTSGKTTVTAMIGHILKECGKSPTILNGGIMQNYDTNMVIGKSDVFVTETDESDGSIASFEPSISVITNITLDHKPLEELRPLFGGFLSKAKQGGIINLDDPESAQFINDKAHTYSLSNEKAHIRAENIEQQPFESRFSIIASDTGNAVNINLPLPGLYNISNALAAITATRRAGIDLDSACKALETFQGTKRRMNVVGMKDFTTVIDDFAHNPDKITASLSALKSFEGRVIAIFQPHGFGPMKLMQDDLFTVFKKHLNKSDWLIMPEIYYAGGTADQSVSSQTLIDKMTALGFQAEYIENRDDIPKFVKDVSKSGDRIIVMGARDDTLTEFANQILEIL